MSHDGNNIKVSFCPVPTPEVQAEIMAASVTENTKTKTNKTTLNESQNKEQGKRPKFGP